MIIVLESQRRYKVNEVKRALFIIGCFSTRHIKRMSLLKMASNKDQKQGVTFVLCIAKRVNHSKLGSRRTEKPKKALPLHRHLINDFPLTHTSY